MMVGGFGAEEVLGGQCMPHNDYQAVNQGV